MKQKIDQRVQLIIQNIRAVRELRNFTQEYVAEMLSISQNAYSKVELGLTKVTVDRILQLATILGVKVSLLISADHRSPIKRDQLDSLKN